MHLRQPPDRGDAAQAAVLLRHVAWTAAGVSGFAQLSQTLADHTLHQLPVIKHLAGALPETSMAAVRLYRLATITAETCMPLEAVS